MDVTEANRYMVEIQQEYVEFLDDAKGDDGVYTKKINEMIDKNLRRIIININDLRKANLERCTRLLENGFEEMPLFQKALREVVSIIDADFAKNNEELFIGLEGSFGAKHVTPRTLTSHFLGNTVCVEGIVTKCSSIRPKVVRSFHYCPKTKKTTERKYADISSFDVMPSTGVYPTKDDDGNLLETEYGLSKYRDHQTITIQEMPEKAPTGQLPRSLDIVLDNDLVDICKPGDRVLIIGVYRCLPGKQNGYTTGIFKAVMLALHVTLMHKDVNVKMTQEEAREVRRFARTTNPFQTLARSLAPSIHGHEYIKKAILCLLLGGEEKILANGTRLRGDINVLLIGDPSVAKSQMLRYVANVAPRVIMTTGRGSSGVGLTAAVTTDMETGERRLEAGAMVLADRGIVCIDEFDKMSDADRTSIHEVMEQGRVTIAKAGIHARLNARTAVLAAANPVYGRYDEYKSPMDNIGLQDSLLSRFDLLFIVLDTADADQDRLIADHVLRMHRYRNPAEQDGEATSMFQDEMTLSTQNPENEKTPAQHFQPYEKHDPLLHGRCRTRSDKILSMDFMKKYIHAAKQIKPVMTDEASKMISEKYAHLRSLNLDDNHMARTQPITARSLETMIRLSTAHARSRLSKFVTKTDASTAIELVEFAYFKRVLEKKKKRRADADADDDSGNEEEPMDEDGGPRSVGSHGNDEGEVGPRSPKRPRQDLVSEGSVVADVEEASESLAQLRGPGADDTEEDMEVQQVLRFIDNDRFKVFQNRLTLLFEQEREESLGLDKVMGWLTAHPQNFTEGEVLGGLDRLTDAGRVMVEENIVFLI